MSATTTVRRSAGQFPAREIPARELSTRSISAGRFSAPAGSPRPSSARATSTPVDRHPGRCGDARRARAGRAAVRRVPAATFRRRRAVVGTVLAVLVAVGAVLAHDVLAGSGGVPASAAASQPARTPGTVTARPGDTLWAIAERHRGDVPISRYVDALVDVNGGASIQAGQAVVLP